MNVIKVSIASDFSQTPGPRYIKEGGFSAELFLEKVLEDKFKEAIRENKKILVDLDGTLGYATSFLEETFGGLARKYGSEKVEKIISFKSQEEPWLIDDIQSYIDDVKNQDK